MSDLVRSSPTIDEITARRDEILALASTYGASNVRIFGSVARGEATPDSDVDLLVTYASDVSLFDVAGLYVALEELLNRHVDIVDDRAIKPYMRASILRDAVSL
jgi:predicted nucleotidyltransferase